jgi:hypothetical protein
MSDDAPREQTNTETDAEGHGLRVPFSAPAKSRMTPARRALAAAVAAKLTLDLLFVCALAVYSQAVSFRADFVGALEYADGRVARGWVSDNARPGSAVELQLYVDGHFAAAGVADIPSAEGSATNDGRRGFEFGLVQLPPGEHEARVYAVRTSRGGARRTLRQIGDPLRFVLK